MGPLQKPFGTSKSRILDQLLEVNPEAYRGGKFGRTNPTSKRLAIATQVRIAQVTTGCQGLIWLKFRGCGLRRGRWTGKERWAKIALNSSVKNGASMNRESRNGA